MRGYSGTTAKRSKNIAQGFSPGLVMRETALKVAAAVVLPTERVCRVRRLHQGTQIVHEGPTTHAFGRHFQGASSGPKNPGLKPWANICNRFAVPK
jgi:hypothetical protein